MLSQPWQKNSGVWGTHGTRGRQGLEKGGGTAGGQDIAQRKRGEGLSRPASTEQWELGKSKISSGNEEEAGFLNSQMACSSPSCIASTLDGSFGEGYFLGCAEF